MAFRLTTRYPLREMEAATLAANFPVTFEAEVQQSLKSCSVS
jgi:hypothetical protein